MARIIHLTNTSRVHIRVNAERIISYYPDNLPKEPETMGTAIWCHPNGAPMHVRETADEIDRLIEPTRT
jgi:hypothetical protein